MDGMEDVPSGVVALSLPVCPPGAKRSEDKEMVTVEVYDTTTLTLTVPSDVMRRRSTLLDVLLVDVNKEELCPQLDGGKAAAELPEMSLCEDLCEETESVEVPPLSELSGADIGALSTTTPDESSVLWKVPVIVIDSDSFDKDPGLKFAV